MTDREALADLLEAIDLAIYSGDWKVDGACDPDAAIQRARNVLAQPEPVKIFHKHQWFRTGEMKVGQMRCISCGTWAKEEI